MTAENLTQRAVVAPVADPVGGRLADLAARWGASCVLEDLRGAVLSHAVAGPVPACVVDAVVTRSAAALHAARGRARAGGLVPGGPVLTTSLEAFDGAVCVVPVVGVGHLWVLGAEPEPAESAAAAAALSDTVSRTCATATDEQLLEALHGTRPHPVAPGGAVVVVRPLEGPRHPAELDALLRTALRAEVTATPTAGYAVLRDTSALAALDGLLDGTLAAAVAGTDEGLVRAREQAEQALDARPVPGRWVTPDEARAYAVLPQLLAAVAGAPVLGRDPLAALDETARGTLLAWLDALGDTAGAARATGAHPNTFRYRLARARELVGADLDDPVARLEVHLRLLAAGPAGVTSPRRGPAGSA